MVKPFKEVTTTTLVLEALGRADDFRTAHQLVEATGRDYAHVTAALHHMKARHAVACLESDGHLWWYATPETDDRSRTVVERALGETRNRRPGIPHPHRRPRRTKT